MRRLQAGVSGILVTPWADEGSPQEPQHSGRKGEAGPTSPSQAFRMQPQPPMTNGNDDPGEWEVREQGFQGALEAAGCLVNTRPEALPHLRRRSQLI